MTIQHDQATWFADTFEQLVANVDVAIKGKAHTIRLALTCGPREASECFTRRTHWRGTGPWRS